MKTITTSTRIPLATRELVALRGIDGISIDCLSGELWITTEGTDEGDLILAAGDHLELKKGVSTAFISALRSANVVVTPHRPDTALRLCARICAGKLYDLYRRWQHAPVAAMPVVWLR